MQDLKGDGLKQYAEICGELMARGHARSGDAVALDGYIGTSDRFVEAIADFATDYANQTEQDYKTFLHSRFAPPSARKRPVKAAGKGAKAKKKQAIKKAAPKT
jgi:thiamine monophosphate kinase